MGTAASAVDFLKYRALQRPLALSPGEVVLCQRTNGAWAHARVHRYAQPSSSTAGEGRGSGTVTLHVGAHARKVFDLSKRRHLARIMVRKSRRDDESDGGSDGDASNNASDDAGSGGAESFGGPAGASKDGSARAPASAPASAAARPPGGCARVAQREPSVFTFEHAASHGSGHGSGSGGGGGKAGGGKGGVPPLSPSSSRFAASLRQMEKQEESIAAATLRHW